MALNAAQIVIVAKDKYSKVVEKMRRVTKGFNTSLKTSGNSLIKFGRKVSKASTALANLRTGFAATMLGMGLRSVNKEAFLFSEAMNRVKKNTMASIPQMKMLANEAMRLNTQTKFTAIQAAEMQGYLGQAGLNAEQIKGLGPKVLSIATAGELMPLAAAKLLKTTLAAYSLDLDKSVDVIDDLAFAATNAQMTMADLMRSLINVAGTAGAVNIPLKDTLAVLAGVAEKAELGSRAGTRLGMTIFRLVKAAGEDGGKAAEALMNLGIPAEEIFESVGKFKEGGLIRFFELLDEKGGTANDVIRIFTQRASRFAIKVLGMSQGMREFRNRMEDTNVTGKAMADIMMEGLYGSTTRVTSAWINMKITIGESLEFITIPLNKMVKKFADWVKDRPKIAKVIGLFMGFSFVLLTIVTIVGVLLASIGSLSILFGHLAVTTGIATSMGTVGFTAMAAAMWAALWPVLLVIGAILLLAAGIIMLIVYWEDVHKWIKKTSDSMINLMMAFNPFLGLTVLLVKHWEKIIGMWEKVKGFFGADTKHEFTSTGTSADQFAKGNARGGAGGSWDLSVDVFNRSPDSIFLKGGDGGTVPMNIDNSMYGGYGMSGGY